MSENALLEPRGLVRQKGWEDLDGTQSGSVGKHNGAVGAHFRLREQKYFKDLALRIGVGEGLELGGGGQRDPAAEVDENDVHQRRQFFGRQPQRAELDLGVRNLVDTKDLTHDVVRIGNRSAAGSALFLQSYGWLHGNSFPLVCKAIRPSIRRITAIWWSRNISQRLRPRPIQMQAAKVLG